MRSAILACFVLLGGCDSIESAIYLDCELKSAGWPERAGNSDAAWLQNRTNIVGALPVPGLLTSGAGKFGVLSVQVEAVDAAALRGTMEYSETLPAQSVQLYPSTAAGLARITYNFDFDRTYNVLTLFRQMRVEAQSAKYQLIRFECRRVVS